MLNGVNARVNRHVDRLKGFRVAQHFCALLPVGLCHTGNEFFHRVMHVKQPVIRPVVSAKTARKMPNRSVPGILYCYAGVDAFMSNRPTTIKVAAITRDG